jgi:hypothetical protein
MTLWRRAPREVYRVYGEDEYLSEDSVHAREEPSPTLADERTRDSRSGRLVGLGLLAGVIVGAVGLVVLNASHQHAARRSEVAHSAPKGAASNPSATVSASPGPAVATSTAFGPHAHAHVPPSASPLHRRWPHTGRVARAAAIATPVGPGQTGLHMAELSGSEGAAPSIDGEFGFER